MDETELGYTELDFGFAMVFPGTKLSGKSMKGELPAIEGVELGVTDWSPCAGHWHGIIDGMSIAVGRHDETGEVCIVQDETDPALWRRLKTELSNYTIEPYLDWKPRMYLIELGTLTPLEANIFLLARDMLRDPRTILAAQLLNSNPVLLAFERINANSDLRSIAQMQADDNPNIVDELASRAIFLD